MTDHEEGLLSYKPSAFYFRRAIREADSKEHVQKVALAMVSEYERLRAWVRDQGMIPPKWRVLNEEARDKRWEKSG